MFRKVATVLAAPLLLVSACAKEGERDALEVKTGDAAVSALRAAPDAVAEAGTAQFEMVMDITMMGEEVEVLASGSIDSAAEQMAMEMDMGALFDQLAAAEGGEEVPPAFRDPWQVVADGSTFYMRAPIFEMIGVEGWLSMDPEDLGATAEGLGLGAGAYDFTQTLESLRGVAGEPEAVGEDEVRGVPTTHYRATMNLAQALEDAPADQRDNVEAAFEQLGGGEELAEVDIPVDVWIDADDLPRRIRMDMGSMFSAAGGGGSATMTLDMFGYGDPVDIEIPSPDEVTPFAEAMGGFGGDDLGS